MSALDDLRGYIVDRLIQIDAQCKRMGVPMDRLTLVARDSTNDAMSVVVTNEPSSDADRLMGVVYERLKQKVRTP